jgi:hypothetical protein
VKSIIITTTTTTTIRITATATLIILLLITTTTSTRVEAFAVVKNSAAYFLGQATCDSLQRVYGISFPDKKLLTKWRTLQEEAAKRDHRKIGTDQVRLSLSALTACPHCLLSLPALAVCPHCPPCLNVLEQAARKGRISLSVCLPTACAHCLSLSALAISTGCLLDWPPACSDCLL